MFMSLYTDGCFILASILASQLYSGPSASKLTASPQSAGEAASDGVVKVH